MTMTIHTIALLLSFVCFVLAAVQPTNPQWNRVISIGLAALVASLIRW